MKKILAILVVFGTFWACRQPANKLQLAERQNYKAKGDSISIISQQTLLKNVSEAIKKQGIVYAVDYCHAEAMPLTNKLSEGSKAQIQRLSNKNRNPVNQLITKEDKAIFQAFKNTSLKDTVVQFRKEYVYYKPIKIGMPTCLKCHGNTETDLSPDVASIIAQKYPIDKATGYQLGDLRGLWKITFKNE